MSGLHPKDGEIGAFALTATPGETGKKNEAGSRPKPCSGRDGGMRDKNGEAGQKNAVPQEGSALYSDQSQRTCLWPRDLLFLWVMQRRNAYPRPSLKQGGELEATMVVVVGGRAPAFPYLLSAAGSAQAGLKRADVSLAGTVSTEAAPPGHAGSI